MKPFLSAASVLFLLGLAAVQAHPGKVSFSEIRIAESSLRQSLVLLTDELLEALPELDVDEDGALQSGEVEEGSELLEGYFRKKIRLETAEGAVDLRLIEAELSIEEVSDAGELPALRAELLFESEQPLDAFAFTCRLLDDVDERHDNFSKIRYGDSVRPFVFTPTNEFRFGAFPEREERAGSLWETFVNFSGYGFGHILVGYDHLLFLLGLMIVSTRFRATAVIVTAFTIGHSISLALAALQVVAVPRSLLEAAIALTIVYVAIENFFSWFPLRRWLLSLSFGLIHGLAFAETLEILELPVSQMVVALLSFNLGIELAQVGVVLAALPLLYWLGRSRKRTQWVRTVSVLIFLCGAFWLIQRTAGSI